MNIEAIQQYLRELQAHLTTGEAREHTYRPAMEKLFSSFDDIQAANDQARTEYGATDFVFRKKSNLNIILGYAEAKDIDVSLDKTEKTEQMSRYAGYENMILTNYIEFRFLHNGEKYKTIEIARRSGLKLTPLPENFAELIDEISAFYDTPPESIKNGKRLAKIMGGKARRIRDNVRHYLDTVGLSDAAEEKELVRIYKMMKELLVHDLTKAKFADMYAQTLVYGLFVARYGDTTPDNFSRIEARDLVPASNPFLRHFFDHIVGPNFDARLSYIVDELCEVFSVSDVQTIVHKHLKIADDTTDVKDPIIHFYEDFLQEYDPEERKKMGAYYTPIPVVKFIVKQVDKILKEDFGIVKGLASDETFTKIVDVGQEVEVIKSGNKRASKTTKVEKEFYRVQVLDPAVGTATFLNETIKYIHEEFKGQEGRWPAYVHENLIKRLHGFELMMAPYTIAHLKLAMTLKETGVGELNNRLGIYLTNTLEEGVPNQRDLFSFGLAEAVSDESRHAAEIKSDHPIMVVMGNPPYSGVSSNDTPYANGLVDKYRFEPGGSQKLQEQKIWLKNDYVKFISFAEEMIEKSGNGVVAMITDHSYLEGPTFRGMRWHLAKSFDKIYILDLHGNSKRKEVSPDGGKDENIFDIMQGVSIILAVKKTNNQETGEVFHADVFGRRSAKFTSLMEEKIEWVKLTLDDKYYYFDNKDTTSQLEYEKNIIVNDLFRQKSLGFMTGRDKFATDLEYKNLANRIENFYDKSLDSDNAKNTFGIKDFRKFIINDFKAQYTYDPKKIHHFLARPFDVRHVYYQHYLVQEWQNRVMKHMQEDNVSLIIGRQSAAAGGPNWDVIFVADSMIDLNIFRRGGGVSFPLWLYHEDGSRSINFDAEELRKLMVNLKKQVALEDNEGDDKYSPEDVLDYIYAVLHSPKYREKYKEFLKIDFPRVPVPKNDDEFVALKTLGTQLRELHLMKSPSIGTYITTFSEPGTNEVEKIKFVVSDEGVGRVYINDNQYFGDVPELAWNFYIGGYQPAQKWLKDRKGRVLSNDDLDHYQKIIKVLAETDSVMQKIDNTWDC